MLTRILNSRILLRNNQIIYLFSKDPFEKFNRKGRKQENINNNTTNDTSKISKPTTQGEQKHEQKNKTTNFQINEEKEHINQNKFQKGFQKFGRKQQKYAREQKKQNIQSKETSEQNKKHPQGLQEKQDNLEKNQHQNINKDNYQTAHKGFEKYLKKNPIEKQKIPQEKSKAEQKKQSTSKLQKQPKKQIKAQNKKEEKPQQKKQSKLQQGKKAGIPKMYVEINENQEIDTVVLRKPRRNKITPSNLSPIIEPQPEPQPQPEPEPEPQQEPEKEYENVILNIEKQKLQKQIEQKQQQRKRQQEQQIRKWQSFESLVSSIKNRIVTNILRYERMGLIKKPIDHSKKEKIIEKQVSIDLKKYLGILVAGGLLLISFSNNKYQFFEDSERVDPQYMKNAFDSKTIQQTWIKRVQVTTHNDETVKGKNYKNYIYIREKNGKISSCISNEDFQKLWFDQVNKYNFEADQRNSQTFNMNQQSNRSSDKIIVLQNVQMVKKSISADIRNTLSLILLFYFVRSIMGLMKGGKGKAGKGGFTGTMDETKSYRLKDAIKVTFKDVVGMQKSKEEIVQFIDFLKHPEKYNKLGARIPTGALLTGPPGTGKTMIAKACAGESKVPFYTISGSQFIEMYVGVGAQRVRSLFKQAKQNAPSIIFIDQIDAVGKKRSGMGGGGNDQRDTTLNQLLVEMDGFDKTTNVIVFAATNQKQVLDPALTRPGRFDRLIEVDLPDLQGRKQIFEVHLKPLRLQANADIKEYARRLATLTPGFSGADIKNVCNEAAIIAARGNKQSVTVIDFELATERIIGGVQKKSQLITPQTRKIVAYHECGHGVVSWFIENASPLLKLTIIPRSKGALGFAQYLPNQHQIYTKKKLLDQISVILGGRIAEQVFFGKISTGASDDLNKAYQIAKSYVTKFGFGDRLGWIQYDETEYAKQYSREIENKIDSEIMQIMRMCSNRTRAIVQQKKDLIHNLAEKLLQLQTIDQSIIQNILGPRPFKLSKQHEQYIKQKKKMSEEVLSLQQKQIEQPLKMRRVDHIL